MDIGQSLQTAFDRLVGFLPNLIAFLVLLVVGYIVAKLVAAGLRKVLEKAGVDRRLHESDAHKYMSVVAGASPARTAGRVAFWLIFAVFVFAAIAALNVPALTSFMDRVVAYLPNIVVAILIFIAAAILAGVVAAAVNRMMGDSPTGRIAGTVLPALVMVIAGFMILQQLKIAEQIVQIAFAATMGALALGLALAFGLGGRPVAQRMLEEAYAKSREKERVAGEEKRERAAREEEARAREKVPQARTPSTGTRGQPPTTETTPGRAPGTGTGEGTGQPPRPS